MQQVELLYTCDPAARQEETQLNLLNVRRDACLCIYYPRSLAFSWTTFALKRAASPLYRGSIRPPVLLVAAELNVPIEFVLLYI